MRAPEASFRVGLYSSSGGIGGAEHTIIRTLSRPGVVAAGIHPIVFSPDPVLRAAVDHLCPGAHTVAVPRDSTAPATVRALRQAFRAERLDLLQIVLHSPWSGRGGALAAYSANIPTLAAEHLVLPSRRRRGRVLKSLWSLPLVAHVVVGEQTALDLTSFYRLRRSTIRVIHNGVDPDTVTPVEYGHRPVIGCAARLETQKGLDGLVAALAMLDDVHLVLVGDGTQRDALARQADEAGVADRLTFVGWQDDARPYIAGFDVFVLPSRDEAFPLTVLEAMAAGTPVVASDVGSVREAVLHDNTGLLVPAGDVEALCTAIERVLTEPGLASRLVDAAHERFLERFTSDHMADAYVRLWLELGRRYSSGRWHVRRGATPLRPTVRETATPVGGTPR